MFQGLVVQNRDVEILAGTPFMEYNDIALRPACQKVTFSDGSFCTYGTTNRATHQVRRIHVVRAPEKSTTLYPGDYLEVNVPDEMANTTLAIEPRSDCSSYSRSLEWPRPEIITSIDGQMPNLTNQPLMIRRNEHFAQVLTVYIPDKPS